MVRNKTDDLTLYQIMERLRIHLNEGRPITLYNTYHGVPISHEADVAMIHPDFLGLIVHPYQAVCIKRERRTFLESKLLPTLIRAHPVSIDYTNLVVMLKELKVPKSISNDLYNSWVAPKDSIIVDISVDGEKDRQVSLAELAVLEKNEIRVVMEVPEDIPYKRHDAVEVAFRLSSLDELIQIQGTVHSLTKIRRQAKRRLEVAGTAPMGDEISILTYVAQREDQIIGDLDRAYQKLRKGKKIR